MALAIDDRHADLLYRKGCTLLELGKDSEAKDYLGLRGGHCFFLTWST